MDKINIIKITTVTIIATGLIMSAEAQAQRSGHGSPPQEAYAACKNKTSGASCSMKTPHGTLSGKCGTPRNASGLVCMPDNGPSQGRMGHQHSGQQHQHGRYHSHGNTPSTRSNRNQNQYGGQGNSRHMREHVVTQSSGDVKLFPATQAPQYRSSFSSEVQGEWRILTSNAIPNHRTGAFPNAGNPHSISQQNFTIRIPARPVLTSSNREVKIPGWALNGVPFDPGAGEFYKGERSSGWQYEALSGAVALGIDVNHAHVQPSGKYHYHGLPTLLMQQMGVTPSKHSPQIGWAVDGFPIYAIYGVKDSKNIKSSIVKMKSSYRLKSGQRPSGSGQPGGKYDGTFVADYEYVPGAGNLDECNGAWTITADYPNGTYAYFLTEDFPVVPRCVKGNVDPSSQGEHRMR